jgi:hypothetical protein
MHLKQKWQFIHNYTRRWFSLNNVKAYKTESNLEMLRMVVEYTCMFNCLKEMNE